MLFNFGRKVNSNNNLTAFYLKIFMIACQFELKFRLLRSKLKQNVSVSLLLAKSFSVGERFLVLV